MAGKDEPPAQAILQEELHAKEREQSEVHPLDLSWPDDGVAELVKVRQEGHNDRKLRRAVLRANRREIVTVLHGGK